jgi:hypothetical protein
MGNYPAEIEFLQLGNSCGLMPYQLFEAEYLKPVVTGGRIYIFVFEKHP